MNRITIGKRTVANIAGSIIACILATGLIIYILNKPVVRDLNIVYIVFLIIIGVIYFIYLIIEIRKPTNAIECDQDYLYLNYKKYFIQIELDSIILATSKCKTQHRHRYRFGKVTIHTKYGAHTVNGIEDCEKVCLNIMRLIKKLA